MLPPFIIEQIRKREEEEKARYEQPRLEIPVPPARPRKEAPDDEANRGVIVVDLLGDD
jgi:hypothetical protein